MIVVVVVMTDFDLRLDPYGAGLYALGRVVNKAGEFSSSDRLMHTGTFLSLIGHFHTKNMEYYKGVLSDILEECGETIGEESLLRHMETVSVCRVISLVAKGTGLEEEVSVLLKNNNAKGKLLSREYAEGFGGVFYDGLRRNLGLRVRERDYAKIVSIGDERLYH